MSRHPERVGGLTRRQWQVLHLVARFIEAHHQAPTRQELATRLGFSRSTADEHLQALRDSGCLRLTKRWRGVELTAKGVRYVRG